jgi:twitching motility protein PilT
MNIHDMLQNLIDRTGSDLHIVVGSPPSIRVDGVLFPIEGTPVLQKEQAETLIFPIMTQEQKDYVTVNKEVDFGYQFKDQGRFRVNVYYEQGNLSASLRLIPSKIKTIDELQLAPIFHQLTQFRQGLVLLTGPTGEGKSTTLAAMIEEINITRADHILTIEDPVEFVYTPQKSVISQREVHQDTHSWEIALRSALREDPDVVLVGEMRDFETIAAAITVAETGHLVFATLHTNSAAQTIDRIIDVFPEHQQSQIRQQLAGSLQAIVAQRLVPKIDGGRVAATEILIVTPAVRNLIREQKTFQLDNVIQTSGEMGMSLLETSLMQWVQRGSISAEVAKEYAVRPEEFERLIGGKGK